jgi:ATP-dependent helicase HepA
VSSFLPGQRWVSNTESELGLGLVTKVVHRRVGLVFPAAGEQRLYAVDNAPLSRVQYQVGEHVSSEDGRTLVIEAVMDADGCLVYSGIGEHGETVELPEGSQQPRAGSVSLRIAFAGQIDKNRLLSCAANHGHNHRLQHSAVRGCLARGQALLPHQLYIAGSFQPLCATRIAGG